MPAGAVCRAVSTVIESGKNGGQAKKRALMTSSSFFLPSCCGGSEKIGDKAETHAGFVDLVTGVLPEQFFQIGRAHV